MGNLGNMLLVAFMVVLGGVPTIYILVSLPVILVQKIYGIVKNGKSFFVKKKRGFVTEPLFSRLTSRVLLGYDKSLKTEKKVWKN